MYEWRKMTAKQREAALLSRQENHVPWRGPPHYEADSALYLITAACYEHQPIIGTSPARMGEFEGELLKTIRAHALQSSPGLAPLSLSGAPPRVEGQGAALPHSIDC